MTKELLTNPSYKQLSPVANIVDGMLKSAASVVSSGGPPVFAPDVLKRAATTRDLAWATTSLTYCVFQLFVAFPKIMAASQKAKEAKKLKEAWGVMIVTVLALLTIVATMAVFTAATTRLSL